MVCILIFTEFLSAVSSNIVIRLCGFGWHLQSQVCQIPQKHLVFLNKCIQFRAKLFFTWLMRNWQLMTLALTFLSTICSILEQLKICMCQNIISTFEYDMKSQLVQFVSKIDTRYTVPQKSEGTVHNFSNYWALHFTERLHSTETHDIPLLDVL